ncbi:MAG TPA: hypothetical protein VIV60_17375 [Polyangiaceae bacterium]
MLVASTSGAIATTACGPSVQFIYESNIRFEHCYRLDFDEQIAPPHRRACWAEWLSLYSAKQTQDRVEYAQRRIRAIDSGDGAVLRLREDFSGTAGSASRGLEGSGPTSLHDPPPARIEVIEQERVPFDSGAAGAAGANGELTGVAGASTKSSMRSASKAKRKAGH